MNKTTVFIVRRGDRLKLLRLPVDGDIAMDNSYREYQSHPAPHGGVSWRSNSVDDRWEEVVGPTMFLKVEEPEVKQTLRVRLLFGGRPHRFQTLTLMDSMHATDHAGRSYTRSENNPRTWIGPHGMEWRSFPDV